MECVFENFKPVFSEEPIGKALWLYTQMKKNHFRCSCVQWFKKNHSDM